MGMPRRCEKCGETFPPYGPYSDYTTCTCHLPNSVDIMGPMVPCRGKLAPYDRRRAAPGVVELVKDLLWAQEFMQQKNWAYKDLADTDEEVDRRNDFLDAIRDHKRFADLCRVALREGGPK